MLNKEVNVVTIQDDVFTEALDILEESILSVRATP
jgi:hypothetical protein